MRRKRERQRAREREQRREGDGVEGNRGEGSQEKDEKFYLLVWLRSLARIDSLTRVQGSLSARVAMKNHGRTKTLEWSA